MSDSSTGSNNNNHNEPSNPSVSQQQQQQQPSSVSPTVSAAVQQQILLQHWSQQLQQQQIMQQRPQSEQQSSSSTSNMTMNTNHQQQQQQQQQLQQAQNEQSQHQNPYNMMMAPLPITTAISPLSHPQQHSQQQQQLPLSQSMPMKPNFPNVTTSGNPVISGTSSIDPNALSNQWAAFLAQHQKQQNDQLQQQKQQQQQQQTPLVATSLNTQQGIVGGMNLVATNTPQPQQQHQHQYHQQQNHQQQQQQQQQQQLQQQQLQQQNQLQAQQQQQQQQQQQLILQQLLTNVLVAQQQQQQQQQSQKPSQQVAPVTSQQQANIPSIAGLPHQFGVNTLINNNNNNNMNNASLATNLMHMQQQQNQMTERQTPAMHTNIVDEIGAQTFNEGWKTMWDDDDVDVTQETFSNNANIATETGHNETTVTYSSTDVNRNATEQRPTQVSSSIHSRTQANANNNTSNVPQEEDWAPTPLSEIRAKQLKRQIEEPTTSINTRNDGPQATSTQLPINNLLSQQPSVLQQLQMSYMQQQSSLYHQPQQPSAPQQTQSLPTPMVRNDNIRSQVPNPLSSTHPQPSRVVDTSSTKATATMSSVQQQHTSAMRLPSTVMPPSVLTSILPLGTRGRAASGGSSATSSSNSTNQNRDVARSGATSQPQKDVKTSSVSYKKKNPITGKSSRVESPQDYLDRIVKLRGFTVISGSKDISRQSVRIPAEHSGYDTVPSPLQLASFGTELVKAVHESDVTKLDKLLSTGLSPNPCNQFSDSIIDLVCKRANTAIFQCLVDHGCDLRVCDGFGRTPLHHCCWASEFNPDIVTLILKSDPQQLFMEDKRGQTPLEYVRPEQASDWIRYIETYANTFFPNGGSLPPVVSLKQVRVHGHIADPPNALPVQLATAVSSGSVSPEELEQMDPVLRARFN